MVTVYTPGAVDQTASNVASNTLAVDTGSDSDRVLLALVMWGAGGSARTINTPTYNGVAMTPLGPQQASQSNRQARLFMLEDPASGTNDLAYSLDTSATWLSVAALVLHGAATATHDSVSEFATGTSQTPQVSITPAAASSRLTALFFSSSGGNDPHTPDAGWDEHLDNGASNHVWNVISKDAAGTSSETAGTTMAASDTWAAWAVEVTEAGGGAEQHSGGSATAVSVADAGEGAKAATGGAGESVAADASGAGVKETEGGIAASVDVDATGAGSKGVAGGAGSSVEATTEGAGEKAAEDGSDATAAIVAAGAGTKDTQGGTAAVVTVVTTGGGFGEQEGESSGGSAVSVTVDAAGAGVKAASGGSSVSVSTTASGAGERAAEGGAAVSVLVVAIGEGTRGIAGGSDAVVVVEVTGGGTSEEVRWWNPDSVGYTRSPVGFTPAGVGYTPKR